MPFDNRAQVFFREPYIGWIKMQDGSLFAFVVTAYCFNIHLVLEIVFFHVEIQSLAFFISAICTIALIDDGVIVFRVFHDASACCGYPLVLDSPKRKGGVVTSEGSTPTDMWGGQVASL